jgi:TRAP transporter TAXI family solute receptor
LGESLATVVNMSGEDLWVTTVATEGSVENCRLMASGKAHAGFVMGSVLAKALEGTGPFTDCGPLGLEAVLRLYSAPEHLVVRRDAGIHHLGELKGHPVSIGLPGSGNRQMALRLLKAAGISAKDDIQSFTLPQDEASRALAAGTIDAAFFNIALPAAAILETSAFSPVSLVPFSAHIVALTAQALPGTSLTVIPAGTYPGQEKDITTLCSDNYLVVPAGQAPRLTFSLASLVMANRDKLARTLDPIGDLTPRSAFPAGFPVSPGARSYFSQQGINGRP